jgi:hypothetical protein
MRKLLPLLFLLVLVPTAAFAQDNNPPDDAWRNGHYRNAYNPHAFELTPFIGYRWGGTVYGDQTEAFNEDLDVESSPNYGLTFGVPLGHTGMKLELMVNHQSSQLAVNRGIFSPEAEVADINVNYYHAGLQIPFAVSPNVVPYAVLSFGMATLDPQLERTSAENRFSGSAGVGVKIPMNHAVSFKVEGRGYFTSLDDNYSNGDCWSCDDYWYDHNFYQGEINLGLTFSF